MLMSPIYVQMCAVEWSSYVPREEHFYRTGEFDKYELKQPDWDPANRQGDLSFHLEFGSDRPKSLASTDMHTHNNTQLLQVNESTHVNATAFFFF
jgi:hypothetical protein